VRPVFCLRGATLERAQNVGQNRHLKLRLSKGTTQLEGIFFSTTAEDCGCAPGSRVDAAFYLQINEFRGRSSVQLQLVDIRPSLSASGREEESLQLVDRCLRGERLLPREAVHLLPSREQCVRAWRTLQHTVPPGGLRTCCLPYLRLLAGSLAGAEPFLRSALCLAVFAERGLLESRRQGDDIILRLTDQGKKVDLDQSIYIRQLHGVLDGPQRGGDAQ
jgi:single-stranded-DNA-specific exonuclease